ncbi:hypothetical protein BaRGS_00028256 [Batillaria attramentaria]|uniref:Uncharacterized protein n=1 Tax=Batillaria attramentaria TaxID=370345 RepID=A0ABD0K0D4_9CAEN
MHKVISSRTYHCSYLGNNFTTTEKAVSRLMKATHLSSDVYSDSISRVGTKLPDDGTCACVLFIHPSEQVPVALSGEALQGNSLKECVMLQMLDKATRLKSAQ